MMFTGDIAERVWELRRREVVGAAVAAVVSLAFLINGIADPDDRIEIDDPESAITSIETWFMGVVFLGCVVAYLAVVVRSCKKQGVALWCRSNPVVSGGRRLHRFEETGSKFVSPRVWKCSICGVRREVTVASSDSGG